MRVYALLSLGALVGAGLAARLSIPTATAPVAPIDRSLQAVACPRPGRCISVGFTGSKYTFDDPLAAVSDAGAWTVRRQPRLSHRAAASPSALACRSESSCVAVGARQTPATSFGAGATGDRPFTETWDGRTWQVRTGKVPVGVTDAELLGVACRSSTCMAVGDYATVAQDDRAMAESWDGKSWTLHMPPTIRTRGEPAESVLADVSCLSPTSCTAVGNVTLELAAIAPPVTVPLIETWDGRAWHVEGVPNTGSMDAELYAVSCRSTKKCIAVGAKVLPSGTYGPLTETWDGARWHELAAPAPPRSTNTTLSAVTCQQSNRCVAVGYSTARSGQQPLIEVWNGKQWRIEPIELPAGFASSVLNSIDCASPARCELVGDYERSTPILHSFSAARTHGVWVARPIHGT